MKQAVLGIVLLLGMRLLAQNMMVASAGAETAAPTSTATGDNKLDAELAQQVPQPQTKAAETAKSEIKRPKSEGSMVGYVDDAIPATQLRLRFDAGFDDPFPDRAEFFYAKCGCYTHANGTSFFDPHAPGPGPGIATDLNFQQLYLFGEYAPVGRFSAFFELPFRWIQPQTFFMPQALGTFGDHGGVSDVSLGLKFAVLDTERSTVSLQLKSYLPSGDASQGLGTGHSSVEPSLLLYHSLSPRWTLEGQFGGWVPINGSRGVPTLDSSSFAGSILIYGLGVSPQVYHNTSVSLNPVVELFGWHLLGGFQTQPGGVAAGIAAPQSGTNIVNVKFGLRTTIHDHNSIYVGYGHAVTDAAWYENLLRVEYRYVF